jgi:hypothetical protein
MLMDSTFLDVGGLMELYDIEEHMLNTLHHMQYLLEEHRLIQQWRAVCLPCSC